MWFCSFHAQLMTTFVPQALVLGFSLRATAGTKVARNEHASTRPTSDISIEFEIRLKFALLWFEIYSTDHNDIFHTYTVVMYTKFRWDRLCILKLEDSKFWSNLEFDWNTVSGTGASWSPSFLATLVPPTPVVSTRRRAPSTDSCVFPSLHEHTFPFRVFPCYRSDMTLMEVSQRTYDSL